MANIIKISIVVMLSLVLNCLGIAGIADAYPRLQLGIEDGVYDATTETIMATSSSFDLYAFASPSGNLTTDQIIEIDDDYDYWLSVALSPATAYDAGGSYGSIFVGGTEIDVTSGMLWGNPPYDDTGGPVPESSSDLPSHGAFDTYFLEVPINFTELQQVAPYNTQDEPDKELTPVGDGGMYYETVSIDMTGLSSDYGLHFDLYALELESQSLKRAVLLDSVEIQTIAFKAPFSHDAGGPPVPEPATFLLIGSGMAALGFYRRRQGHK